MKSTKSQKKQERINTLEAENLGSAKRLQAINLISSTKTVEFIFANFDKTLTIEQLQRIQAVLSEIRREQKEL